MQQTLVSYAESTNTTYSINAAFDDAGNTFALGVSGEDDATGNADVGAIYVYSRNATSGQWSQSSRLTANHADANNQFGVSLAMNDAGNKLLICALEDSATVGVDGDQTDNGADSAGGAYLFELVNDVWQQTAYIKPPNTQAGDTFVLCAMSGDGKTSAIGAPFEDGGNGGVAPSASESATNAGAV